MGWVLALVCVEVRVHAVRSLASSSPHLGDVQEAVDTLEVDEEAVVGHGRDGPLAELLGVGAGEVGHVLDHLGGGGLGDLSLAEGKKAHVDAAELLVNLGRYRTGVGGEQEGKMGRGSIG